MTDNTDDIGTIAYLAGAAVKEDECRALLAERDQLRARVDGLNAEIEKLSQKFNSDDLVLVDRTATGSGFSLASEPLRTIYGKQAVYFFSQRLGSPFTHLRNLSRIVR